MKKYSFQLRIVVGILLLVGFLACVVELFRDWVDAIRHSEQTGADYWTVLAAGSVMLLGTLVLGLPIVIRGWHAEKKRWNERER